ncbi:inactive glucose-1-phosphate adenylyltransferase small subunit 2, chloroplastic [Tripterygium wilfordii]|uniref:inactive glucose-1-phosphate adenylyltransferase small subunit 2, chloroplastic n=1 Tax=Tripterygium wilfordii TaxID=458696 RepID=UPI0018F833CA|nr:inactive glucose-1-phosphate adenylyltransferase small subunit 2, chloroplastic [Tripterygium wilfordii]
MVLLKSYSCNPVNLQAKLPSLGLPHCVQRCSYDPSSSSIPRLHISNSQEPQNPILLFPTNVAAIVFGDGSESRLYPLTKRRSEGAIPIAANYRLVDTVVSNCINSNINKIYALTQFNSTSLNSHLSRAYSGVGLGMEGFVEVIAAYQSLEDQGWFQGTADAMRRCSWILEEYPVSEFLVLPGHHLYRMNYQKLIETHRKGKADITAVALSTARNQDPGFGLLKIDAENQVLEFTVKSETEPSKYISVRSSRNPVEIASIDKWSMGIFLINRDIMLKLLHEHFPKANDFQSEVITGAISRGMKVQAYLFDGYWNDMRSIKSYYQANMECIEKSNLGYNFSDRDSPLYTMPRNLPPTLISDAVITDSIIGDGCIIKRCKIKGTVIGMNTRIDDGAVIEDSVIMGFDICEVEGVQRSSRDGKGNGIIPIGIGENTHIRKSIIDKNARIGKNVMIINKDKVQEGDREADGYIIKEGIVVVLHSAILPDGSIL